LPGNVLIDENEPRAGSAHDCRREMVPSALIQKCQAGTRFAYLGLLFAGFTNT
jgi:hypothetical protein